jgi:diadenosine tetraphosphate (Ap4A) HIT family hydrolase
LSIIKPFELDPRLAGDTLEVCDLPLSSVRLMNDCRFPWLILVPRRANAVEINDLEPADRLRLWDEVATVSRTLEAIAKPKKLNVAAIGNIVAQLHVHIVARRENDAAWPRPVWGVGVAETYLPSLADALIASLNERLIDAI